MQDNPSPGHPADFDRILAETERRVKTSQHGHWRATDRFEGLSRGATVLAIAGGVAVSALSTVPIQFGAFYHRFEFGINVALFLLGLFVSSLSVVQSVLKWSERAQSHLIAANAYSTMRRELEILRLGLPDSAGTLGSVIRRPIPTVIKNDAWYSLFSAQTPHGSSHRLGRAVALAKRDESTSSRLGVNALSETTPAVPAAIWAQAVKEIKTGK